MEGFIPPWEYKIHRISSISGWYAALSRDVSEFCEGVPASLPSSGGGPDATPFEIGSRGSGCSAVCSWGVVAGLSRCLVRLCALSQSFLAVIHSASKLNCARHPSQATCPMKRKNTCPRMPRTCHHFVPPTTLFITASPPNALIRHVAASSQEARGMMRRTTWTDGGDGVRMFEKDCSSSTVCLRIRS
jgi:hypothetical protein